MNKKFLTVSPENRTNRKKLDVKAIPVKTTLLFIFVSAFIIIGCSGNKEIDKNNGKSVSDSSTTDPGVVINGITWATRNVDAPGTFAETPESTGMFYQWNSKIGWSSSNPIKNTNGDSSWFVTSRMITKWTEENDPSPKGWRLPTIDEIKGLLDTQKVIREWITQNGTNGLKFTDKVNGNTIFLPAAGSRGYSGSLIPAGVRGDYMSQSVHPKYNEYAEYLYFGKSQSGCGNGNISGQGNSIRCVLK